MSRSHRLTGLLLMIAAFLTVCQPAAAYIDAGSGSYLLQILFAALFGGVFMIKSAFRNLKAMVLHRPIPVSASTEVEPREL